MAQNFQGSNCNARKYQRKGAQTGTSILFSNGIFLTDLPAKWRRCSTHQSAGEWKRW